jgi:hypothetical protein
MSVDIDAFIREFHDALTAAELNYEIWWVYRGHDTRPKFIDTMSRYPVFFRMSIHAHFLATIVALSRLYETRKDSYNIGTKSLVIDRSPIPLKKSSKKPKRLRMNSSC